MQNLKRNWLVVSKLTWGIWRIFTRVLKSLKNLHFNGLLWTKFIMFELKKYRGVMFHDIKDWSKISRKIDLRFGKWHEEFGKFLSAFESLKLGHLWDPFIQSRKCTGLKFTEELCVMAMKNRAKFEEELTFRFKIGMRNLTNCDPSLKNVHFNPPFRSRHKSRLFHVNVFYAIMEDN